MALACLARHAHPTCNPSAQQGPPPARLVAFIVDHGLRPESSAEARTVKDYVENKIGIPAEILTAVRLKEKIHESGSNLETLARSARYDLLGAACLRHGIRNLLLAHHAADVYETALMRKVVLSGKVNLIMEGHQALPVLGQANYGLRFSGCPEDSPLLDIGTNSKGVLGSESGGIWMLRPLLNCQKDDLVQLLKDNNIPWIEDPSNHDVTLTTRNAIRSLDQSQMPSALRKQYLLPAVQSAAVRYKTYTDASMVLIEASQIKFDPYVGMFYVRLPTWAAVVKQCEEFKLNQPRFLATHLLRLVADTVDPAMTSSLSGFDTLIKYVFPESTVDFEPDPTFSWQVGAVQFKSLEIKPEVPWPPKNVSGKLELNPREYLSVFRAPLTLAGVRHPARFNRLFDIPPIILHERNDSATPAHYSAGIPQDKMEETLPLGTCDVVNSDPDNAEVSNSTNRNKRSSAETLFHLFDNRFWISVKNTTPFNLILKTATFEDLAHLGQQLREGKVDIISPHLHDVKELKRTLRFDPLRQLGHSQIAIAKLVIPILVYSPSGESYVGDSKTSGSQILAFPTLGIRVIKKFDRIENNVLDWSKDISWITRYKHIAWLRFNSLEKDQITRPDTIVTRYAWNKIMSSRPSHLSAEMRRLLHLISEQKQEAGSKLRKLHNTATTLPLAHEDTSFVPLARNSIVRRTIPSFKVRTVRANLVEQTDTDVVPSQKDHYSIMDESRLKIRKVYEPLNVDITIQSEQDGSRHHDMLLNKLSNILGPDGSVSETASQENTGVNITDLLAKAKTEWQRGRQRKRRKQYKTDGEDVYEVTRKKSASDEKRKQSAALLQMERIQSASSPGTTLNTRNPEDALATLMQMAGSSNGNEYASQPVTALSTAESLDASDDLAALRQLAISSNSRFTKPNAVQPRKPPPMKPDIFDLDELSAVLKKADPLMPKSSPVNTANDQGKGITISRPNLGPSISSNGSTRNSLPQSTIRRRRVRR
jgi:hypothetical protein